MLEDPRSITACTHLLFIAKRIGDHATNIAENVWFVAHGVAMKEMREKPTKLFPFTCRKADPDNPLLRELLVSFGTSCHVALHDIGDGHTVTILAVRHQREDDYG